MENDRTAFAGIEIARELWRFTVRPRAVVAARKTDWSRPLSAAAVLGWCAGAVVAIWGLYGLAFGSMVDQMLQAQSAEPASEQPAPTAAEDPPAEAGEIVDWGLAPMVSFGIQFPEIAGTPSDLPQRGVFTCGLGYVIIDNVVPARLSRGAFPFLMLALAATVAVLCLFPPARLLGGAGSPLDALRMSALFCSYSALGSSIVIVGAASFVIHLLGATGWLLAILWALVQVPAVVFVFRGYLLGFSELYGLSKRRLLLASAGALLLTTVVAPAVFIPGVILLVRFQAVWDVFF